MRVLLVDHDSEGLETITRAIRGVLELDCVTSKGDALLLLRQNTYDVLIACERCVDGSGLDLLGRTTRTAVPLKRIFAAAPERLQLLGPRLAPFKVQRTINYPIDLEELWLAIAQVTSGPNEETDGTIERVVLDERGIPAAGSSPRAPIPPRPPAPLREVAPPAPPAPAVAASAGRAAAARLAQPVPEPPLRAPPSPRMPPPATRAPAPPRTTSDTGRMRAPVPPKTPSDTGRMRAPSFEPARAPTFDAAPPLPAMEPQFPSWEPEMPGEDELAEVAAQARFGVQQKVASEASRRRVSKILMVSAIVVVVAGTLVFAFEKFYDPAARAREKAIAQDFERMVEEQKVSDNLAGIEFDFETAITNGELDTARTLLATLIEKSPDHPRRDFLQKTLERETELAKLTGKTAAKAKESAVASVPAAGERAPARPRAEKNTQRSNDRTSARMPRATSPRSVNELAPPNNRTYGAPIGESPRQTIPLNAPINADPVTSVRRNDNAFAGRTVEEVGQPPAPAPAAAAGSVAATPGNAGSATVPMPSAAPPAPQPPAPVDVVPAKIVKRVAPVAAGNIPAKTKGYVVVRFNIGVNGRVSDLEVVESDPQGVFDEAAQDAVRKWVYEPRKENGVAVESTAKARLVFDAAN
jgi:TonB family protein